MPAETDKGVSVLATAHAKHSKCEAPLPEKAEQMHKMVVISNAELQALVSDYIAVSLDGLQRVALILDKGNERLQGCHEPSQGILVPMQRVHWLACSLGAAVNHIHYQAIEGQTLSQSLARPQHGADWKMAIIVPALLCLRQ